MNYDVQIGNTIRRGISYAELVAFPIEPETFVRRENGDWIHAKDCTELTHILVQRPATPSNHTTSISHSRSSNFSPEDYVKEGIYDYVDTAKEDEIVEAPQSTLQNPFAPGTPVPPNHNNNDVDEERIFIPTAEYFKCKQKRKAAIIGVCSLGLAGLSLIGVGNTWRSNIFADTSFSANAGIGFVLKCLSFCLLTAIIAIPYFIYSVFALIYYSIRLNNLKR